MERIWPIAAVCPELLTETANTASVPFSFAHLMTYPTCTNIVSGMTPPDLDEVVAVHIRSFPGFFLSQMGKRFLLCLYQEILADPSGIALVCKQGQTVRAFAAGTTEPRGFYKRLLARRWRRFALASVVPMLRNPMIAARLLNAFRKAKEEPADEGSGLLMSIAVNPEARSGGTGAALVHEFLMECQRQGLSSVHLTTDRFENARANRFYSNLGFTVSRVFTTRQGRIMNDYRLAIAGTSMTKVESAMGRHQELSLRTATPSPNTVNCGESLSGNRTNLITRVCYYASSCGCVHECAGRDETATDQYGTCC